jgi:hypothetical protein
MASHAGSAAEAEEPRIPKRGAGFFRDLAPHRLGRGFMRLRTTRGQIPGQAVAADEDDVIPGDTDHGRAVRCARGRLEWWPPGYAPVLPVHGHQQLDAVRRKIAHANAVVAVGAHLRGTGTEGA